MPLPKIVNPGLVGPAGFIQWLRTEPRFRAAYAAVKDKAPHLVKSAAMGAVDWRVPDAPFSPGSRLGTDNFPLRGARAFTEIGTHSMWLGDPDPDPGLGDPDPGLGTDMFPLRGARAWTEIGTHSMALGQDDVTSTFISPSMTDVTAQADFVPMADPTAPGGEPAGWADTVAKLVTPVVTGVEQIKLFNTQLQLAQAGKPLLDTSHMRLPTVPVGVTLQAGQGMGMALAAGAAILGALFLFGGRRRA